MSSFDSFDSFDTAIPNSKNQKAYYSGKKKRHTIKTQVIIERKNRRILDIQQEKGSIHDFKLYKDSIGEAVDESILILADLGYLGIAALHGNSQTPKKSSKNHKLTLQEKAYNKSLSRKRVVIEHINAKIKTFKIMAYPYRNHRRRHFLRMSFVCGIINFELNS